MMTETSPFPIVSARQSISNLGAIHPLLNGVINSSLGQTMSEEPLPPPMQKLQNPGRINFRLDENHHPLISELSKAGNWFCQLLRGKERKPASLAISGPPGTGKTHTARIIKWCAESYGVDIICTKGISHWSCLWIDWVRIAEAEQEWRYESLLEEIKDASLVVLDDVGSEHDRFKSGIPCSRLGRVLREIERKWVVLTCNPTKSQIIDLYDARVADRLRAFQWMELGGVPSYRPKLIHP